MMKRKKQISNKKLLRAFGTSLALLSQSFAAAKTINLNFNRPTLEQLDSHQAHTNLRSIATSGSTISLIELFGNPKLAKAILAATKLANPDFDNRLGIYSQISAEDLGRIEVLNLNNLGLSSLDPLFQHDLVWKKLHTLNVSNNRFGNKLKLEISAMPKLYKLLAINSGLTIFPDLSSYAGSHQLRYLDLAYNQINQLPEYLANFNLGYLDLAHNNLHNSLQSDFLAVHPDQFDHKLPTLNFSGYNDQLGVTNHFDVDRLKAPYLNLSGNRLTKFPAVSGSINKLDTNSSLVEQSAHPVWSYTKDGFIQRFNLTKFFTLNDLFAIPLFKNAVVSIGNQSYDRSNYQQFQGQLGDFHLSFFNETFTNINEIEIFVFDQIDSTVANHLPKSLDDHQFPLLTQKFGGEKLNKVLASRITKNDIRHGQGVFWDSKSNFDQTMIQAISLSEIELIADDYQGTLTYQFELPINEGHNFRKITVQNTLSGFAKSRIRIKDAQVSELDLSKQNHQVLRLKAPSTLINLANRFGLRTITSSVIADYLESSYIGNSQGDGVFTKLNSNFINIQAIDEAKGQLYFTIEIPDYVYANHQGFAQLPPEYQGLTYQLTGFKPTQLSVIGQVAFADQEQSVLSSALAVNQFKINRQADFVKLMSRQPSTITAADLLNVGAVVSNRSDFAQITETNADQYFKLAANDQDHILSWTLSLPGDHDHNLRPTSVTVVWSDFQSDRFNEEYGSLKHGLKTNRQSAQTTKTISYHDLGQNQSIDLNESFTGTNLKLAAKQGVNLDQVFAQTLLNQGSFSSRFADPVSGLDVDQISVQELNDGTQALTLSFKDRTDHDLKALFSYLALNSQPAQINNEGRLTWDDCSLEYGMLLEQAFLKAVDNYNQQHQNQPINLTKISAINLGADFIITNSNSSDQYFVNGKFKDFYGHSLLYGFLHHLGTYHDQAISNDDNPYYQKTYSFTKLQQQQDIAQYLRIIDHSKNDQLIPQIISLGYFKNFNSLLAGVKLFDPINNVSSTKTIYLSIDGFSDLSNDLSNVSLTQLRLSGQATQILPSAVNDQNFEQYLVAPQFSNGVLGQKYQLKITHFQANDQNGTLTLTYSISGQDPVTGQTITDSSPRLLTVTGFGNIKQQSKITFNNTVNQLRVGLRPGVQLDQALKQLGVSLNHQGYFSPNYLAELKVDPSKTSIIKTTNGNYHLGLGFSGFDYQATKALFALASQDDGSIVAKLAKTTHDYLNQLDQANLINKQAIATISYGQPAQAVPNYDSALTISKLSNSQVSTISSKLIATTTLNSGVLAITDLNRYRLQLAPSYQLAKISTDTIFTITGCDHDQVNIKLQGLGYNQDNSQLILNWALNSVAQPEIQTTKTVVIDGVKINHPAKNKIITINQSAEERAELKRLTQIQSRIKLVDSNQNYYGSQLIKGTKYTDGDQAKVLANLKLTNLDQVEDSQLVLTDFVPNNFSGIAKLTFHLRSIKPGLTHLVTTKPLVLNAKFNSYINDVDHSSIHWTINQPTPRRAVLEAKHVTDVLSEPIFYKPLDAVKKVDILGVDPVGDSKVAVAYQVSIAPDDTFEPLTSKRPLITVVDGLLSDAQAAEAVDFSFKLRPLAGKTTINNLTLTNFDQLVDATPSIDYYGLKPKYVVQQLIPNQQGVQVAYLVDYAGQESYLKLGQLNLNADSSDATFLQHLLDNLTFERSSKSSYRLSRQNASDFIKTSENEPILRTKAQISKFSKEFTPSVWTKAMNNAGVDFHITQVTADDHRGQLTVTTQARLNNTVRTKDYQINGFANNAHGLAKLLVSFTPKSRDFYPSEINAANFVQNFDLKYPTIKGNNQLNYQLTSLDANDAEGSLKINYQISLIVDGQKVYSPIKTAIVYGLKVNYKDQTTRQLNQMVRQLTATAKVTAQNYYPSTLLKNKLNGAVKNSTLTSWPTNAQALSFANTKIVVEPDQSNRYLFLQFNNWSSQQLSGLIGYLALHGNNADAYFNRITEVIKDSLTQLSDQNISLIILLGNDIDLSTQSTDLTHIDSSLILKPKQNFTKNTSFDQITQLVRLHSQLTQNQLATANPFLAGLGYQYLNDQAQQSILDALDLKQPATNAKLIVDQVYADDAQGELILGLKYFKNQIWSATQFLLVKDFNSYQQLVDNTQATFVLKPEVHGLTAEAVTTNNFVDLIDVQLNSFNTNVQIVQLSDDNNQLIIDYQVTTTVNGVTYTSSQKTATLDLTKLSFGFQLKNQMATLPSNVTLENFNQFINKTVTSLTVVAVVANDQTGQLTVYYQDVDGLTHSSVINGFMTLDNYWSQLHADFELNELGNGVVASKITPTNLSQYATISGLGPNDQINILNVVPDLKGVLTINYQVVHGQFLSPTKTAVLGGFRSVATDLALGYATWSWSGKPQLPSQIINNYQQLLLSTIHDVQSSGVTVAIVGLTPKDDFGSLIINYRLLVQGHQSEIKTFTLDNLSQKTGSKLRRSVRQSSTTHPVFTTTPKVSLATLDPLKVDVNNFHNYFDLTGPVNWKPTVDHIAHDVTNKSLVLFTTLNTDQGKIPYQTSLTGFADPGIDQQNELNQLLHEQQNSNNYLTTSARQSAINDAVVAWSNAKMSLARMPAHIITQKEQEQVEQQSNTKLITFSRRENRYFIPSDITNNQTFWYAINVTGLDKNYSISDFTFTEPDDVNGTLKVKFKVFHLEKDGFHVQAHEFREQEIVGLYKITDELKNLTIQEMRPRFYWFQDNSKNLATIPWLPSQVGVEQLRSYFRPIIANYHVKTNRINVHFLSTEADDSQGTLKVKYQFEIAGHKSAEKEIIISNMLTSAQNLAQSSLKLVPKTQNFNTYFHYLYQTTLASQVTIHNLHEFFDLQVVGSNIPLKPIIHKIISADDLGMLGIEYELVSQGEQPILDQQMIEQKTSTELLNYQPIGNKKIVLFKGFLDSFLASSKINHGATFLHMTRRLDAPFILPSQVVLPLGPNKTTQEFQLNPHGIPYTRSGLQQNDDGSWNFDQVVDAQHAVFDPNKEISVYQIVPDDTHGRLGVFYRYNLNNNVDERYGFTWAQGFASISSLREQEVHATKRLDAFNLYPDEVVTDRNSSTLNFSNSNIEFIGPTQDLVVDLAHSGWGDQDYNDLDIQRDTLRKPKPLRINFAGWSSNAIEELLHFLYVNLTNGNQNAQLWTYRLAQAISEYLKHNPGDVSYFVFGDAKLELPTYSDMRYLGDVFLVDASNINPSKNRVSRATVYDYQQDRGIKTTNLTSTTNNWFRDLLTYDKVYKFARGTTNSARVITNSNNASILTEQQKQQILQQINISTDPLVNYEILDVLSDNTTGVLEVLVAKRFAHHSGSALQWVRVNSFKSFEWELNQRRVLFDWNDRYLKKQLNNEEQPEDTSINNFNARFTKKWSASGWTLERSKPKFIASNHNKTKFDVDLEIQSVETLADKQIRVTYVLTATHDNMVVRSKIKSALMPKWGSLDNILATTDNEKFIPKTNSLVNDVSNFNQVLPSSIGKDNLLEWFNFQNALDSDIVPVIHAVKADDANGLIYIIYRTKYSTKKNINPAESPRDKVFIYQGLKSISSGPANIGVVLTAQGVQTLPSNISLSDWNHAFTISNPGLGNIEIQNFNNPDDDAGTISFSYTVQPLNNGHNNVVPAVKNFTVTGLRTTQQEVDAVRANWQIQSEKIFKNYASEVTTANVTQYLLTPKIIGNNSSATTVEIINLVADNENGTLTISYRGKKVVNNQTHLSTSEQTTTVSGFLTYQQDVNQTLIDFHFKPAAFSHRAEADISKNLTSLLIPNLESTTLHNNVNDQITYQLIDAANTRKNATSGLDSLGYLWISYKPKLVVNGHTYISVHQRYYLVSGFKDNEKVKLQLLNTTATWTKKTNTPINPRSITKRNLSNYFNQPTLTTDSAYTAETKTSDITVEVLDVQSQFDGVNNFLLIKYKLKKFGFFVTKQAVVTLISPAQQAEQIRLDREADNIIWTKVGPNNDQLPQPLSDAVGQILDDNDKLTKVTSTIATHSRLNQAQIKIVSTTADNSAGTITISYQLITTKTGELAGIMSKVKTKVVGNWQTNQAALEFGQVTWRVNQGDRTYPTTITNKNLLSGHTSSQIIGLSDSSNVNIQIQKISDQNDNDGTLLVTYVLSKGRNTTAVKTTTVSGWLTVADDLNETEVIFTKKSNVPATTRASSINQSNLATFVDQKYTNHVDSAATTHFSTQVLSVIPNDVDGTLTITYRLTSNRGIGTTTSGNKTKTVDGFYTTTRELDALDVTWTVKEPHVIASEVNSQNYLTKLNLNNPNTNFRISDIRFENANNISGTLKVKYKLRDSSGNQSSEKTADINGFWTLKQDVDQSTYQWSINPQASLLLASSFKHDTQINILKHLNNNRSAISNNYYDSSLYSSNITSFTADDDNGILTIQYTLSIIDNTTTITSNSKTATINGYLTKARNLALTNATWTTLPASSSIKSSELTAANFATYLSGPRLSSPEAKNVKAVITKLYSNDELGQLTIEYQIVEKTSTATDDYSVATKTSQEIKTLISNSSTSGKKYCTIFGFLPKSQTDAEKQKLLNTPLFFAWKISGALVLPSKIVENAQVGQNEKSFADVITHSSLAQSISLKLVDLYPDDQHGNLIFVYSLTENNNTVNRVGKLTGLLTSRDVQAEVTEDQLENSTWIHQPTSTYPDEDAHNSWSSDLQRYLGPTTAENLVVDHSASKKFAGTVANPSASFYIKFKDWDEAKLKALFQFIASNPQNPDSEQWLFYLDQAVRRYIGDYAGTNFVVGLGSQAQGGLASIDNLDPSVVTKISFSQDDLDTENNNIKGIKSDKTSANSLYTIGGNITSTKVINNINPTDLFAQDKLKTSARQWVGQALLWTLVNNSSNLNNNVNSGISNELKLFQNSTGNLTFDPTKSSTSASNNKYTIKLQFSGWDDQALKQLLSFVKLHPNNPQALNLVRMLQREISRFIQSNNNGLTQNNIEKIILGTENINQADAHTHWNVLGFSQQAEQSAGGVEKTTVLDTTNQTIKISSLSNRDWLTTLLRFNLNDGVDQKNYLSDNDNSAIYLVSKAAQPLSDIPQLMRELVTTSQLNPNTKIRIYATKPDNVNGKLFVWLGFHEQSLEDQFGVDTTVRLVVLSDYLNYVKDLDSNAYAGFVLKDNANAVYASTFSTNPTSVSDYLTDQSKNNILGTKIKNKTLTSTPTFAIDIVGVKDADDTTGSITIQYKPKMTLNNQQYVGTVVKEFTVPVGFLTYQKDVNDTIVTWNKKQGANLVAASAINIPTAPGSNFDTYLSSGTKSNSQKSEITYRIINLVADDTTGTLNIQYVTELTVGNKVYTSKLKTTSVTDFANPKDIANAINPTATLTIAAKSLRASMVNEQNYKNTIILSGLPAGYRLVEERFEDADDTLGSVRMYFKVLGVDGVSKSEEKHLDLGANSVEPTYLTLAQDAAQTRFYWQIKADAFQNDYGTKVTTGNYTDYLENVYSVGNVGAVAPQIVKISADDEKGEVTVTYQVTANGANHQSITSTQTFTTTIHGFLSYQIDANQTILTIRANAAAAQILPSSVKDADIKNYLDEKTKNFDHHHIDVNNLSYEFQDVSDTATNPTLTSDDGGVLGLKYQIVLTKPDGTKVKSTIDRYLFISGFKTTYQDTFDKLRDLSVEFTPKTPVPIAKMVDINNFDSYVQKTFKKNHGTENASDQEHQGVTVKILKVEPREAFGILLISYQLEKNNISVFKGVAISSGWKIDGEAEKIRLNIEGANLRLTNEKLTTNYASELIRSYVDDQGNVTNPEQNSDFILQLLKINKRPLYAQILITKAVANDDQGTLTLTIKLASTVMGYNGRKPSWDKSSTPAPKIESNEFNVVVSTKPFFTYQDDINQATKDWSLKLDQYNHLASELTDNNFSTWTQPFSQEFKNLKNKDDVTVKVTVSPADDVKGTAEIKYVLIKDTNPSSADPTQAQFVFPTTADQLVVDQAKSIIWTDPQTQMSEVFVQFQGWSDQTVKELFSYLAQGFSSHQQDVEKWINKITQVVNSYLQQKAGEANTQFKIEKINKLGFWSRLVNQTRSLNPPVSTNPTQKNVPVKLSSLYFDTMAPNPFVITANANITQNFNGIDPHDLFSADNYFQNVQTQLDQIIKWHLGKYQTDDHLFSSLADNTALYQLKPSQRISNVKFGSIRGFVTLGSYLNNLKVSNWNHKATVDLTQLLPNDITLDNFNSYFADPTTQPAYHQNITVRPVILVPDGTNGKLTVIFQTNFTDPDTGQIYNASTYGSYEITGFNTFANHANKFNVTLIPKPNIQITPSQVTKENILQLTDPKNLGSQMKIEVVEVTNQQPNNPNNKNVQVKYHIISDSGVKSSVITQAVGPFTSLQEVADQAQVNWNIAEAGLHRIAASSLVNVTPNSTEIGTNYVSANPEWLNVSSQEHKRIKIIRAHADDVTGTLFVHYQIEILDDTDTNVIVTSREKTDQITGFMTVQNLADWELANWTLKDPSPNYLPSMVDKPDAVNSNWSSIFNGPRWSTLPEIAPVTRTYHTPFVANILEITPNDHLGILTIKYTTDYYDQNGKKTAGKFVKTQVIKGFYNENTWANKLAQETEMNFAKKPSVPANEKPSSTTLTNVDTKLYYEKTSLHNSGDTEIITRTKITSLIPNDATGELTVYYYVEVNGIKGPTRTKVVSGFDSVLSDLKQLIDQLANGDSDQIITRLPGTVNGTPSKILKELGITPNTSLTPDQVRKLLSLLKLNIPENTKVEIASVTSSDAFGQMAITYQIIGVDHRLTGPQPRSDYLTSIVQFEGDHEWLNQQTITVNNKPKAAKTYVNSMNRNYSDYLDIKPAKNTYLSNEDFSEVQNVDNHKGTGDLQYKLSKDSKETIDAANLELSGISDPWAGSTTTLDKYQVSIKGLVPLYNANNVITKSLSDQWSTFLDWAKANKDQMVVKAIVNRLAQLLAKQFASKTAPNAQIQLGPDQHNLLTFNTKPTFSSIKAKLNQFLSQPGLISNNVNNQRLNLSLTIKSDAKTLKLNNFLTYQKDVNDTLVTSATIDINYQLAQTILAEELTKNNIGNYVQFHTSNPNFHRLGQGNDPGDPAPECEIVSVHGSNVDGSAVVAYKVKIIPRENNGNQGAPINSYMKYLLIKPGTFLKSWQTLDKYLVHAHALAALAHRLPSELTNGINSLDQILSIAEIEDLADDHSMIDIQATPDDDHGTIIIKYKLKNKNTNQISKEKTLVISGYSTKEQFFSKTQVIFSFKKDISDKYATFITNTNLNDYIQNTALKSLNSPKLTVSEQRISNWDNERGQITLSYKLTVGSSFQILTTKLHGFKTLDPHWHSTTTKVQVDQETFTYDPNLNNVDIVVDGALIEGMHQKPASQLTIDYLINHDLIMSSSLKDAYGFDPKTNQSHKNQITLTHSDSAGWVKLTIDNLTGNTTNGLPKLRHTVTFKNLFNFSSKFEPTFASLKYFGLYDVKQLNNLTNKPLLFALLDKLNFRISPDPKTNDQQFITKIKERFSLQSNNQPISSKGTDDPANQVYTVNNIQYNYSKIKIVNNNQLVFEPGAITLTDYYQDGTHYQINPKSNDQNVLIQLHSSTEITRRLTDREFLTYEVLSWILIVIGALILTFVIYMYIHSYRRRYFWYQRQEIKVRSFPFKRKQTKN